ncbi:PA domain-containing protein [Aquipuribacter nitratireducens]|uniref:PA domain-containing protein n=1 Tax=Aquipuribacter nitratireducens TaxID=650104 RepID=A0ABW0GR66_9MICO
MRRRLPAAIAAGAAATLLLPMAAYAHPDHGQQSGKEMFPGEGVIVEGDKQHGGDEGHLDPVSYGVEVVGKAPVSPTEGGLEGRVADVYAKGDYAYLTSFRGNGTDACVGGVFVMDISDLENPAEVPDSFIPTSPGSYAGEGVQVITIGKRDVLIHQNETCPGATPDAGTFGGINLWDVTDPTNPVQLAAHAGDTDGGASANTVHSFYAWYDHKSKRTWAALVDNEEFADVDIMDISDPANPVMVNDTLDMEALFGVSQDSPAGLTSIFSHDMDVVKLGSKYVMSLNYWDGGYVVLDVSDPRPGAVKLIAESDYAALDEERLARGQEISPEGNAHQSEISPNGKFLIGTDEDFNPFRIVATIDSGPYAGTEFRAVQAGGTPAISEDQSISGPTTFVGEACSALPAGSGTALVERGTCAFQVKLDNITAAGYDAGIVFNAVRADCETYVNMLADSETTPFVFVNRTTGLQMLGIDPTSSPCTVASPAVGSGSADVTIEAIFDGWGYVRLFSTDIPRSPKETTGSISQIDTYAVEESQDPAYAEGYGDLSVHEVAIDPDENLAYLSYYAAGFRVVEYGKDGMTEVGAFIDEGGNNFWGVEVIERDGETYVLASDRDYGLYVFQTP